MIDEKILLKELKAEHKKIVASYLKENDILLAAEILAWEAAMKIVKNQKKVKCVAVIEGAKEAPASVSLKEKGIPKKVAQEWEHITESLRRYM